MTERLKPISYSDFGHNFIHHVVTAKRVRGEIEAVLRSTIEGSIQALPANLLLVSYSFRLRDVTVEPLVRRLPNLSFVLIVTGDMRLDVEFLNLEFKFMPDVEIRLQIDVETYAPLTLKLVPHAITLSDVDVALNGENLPGEVVSALQILRPIVRDQIVREVNARIASPELQKAGTIDVLALAESAQLSSSGPATTAADTAEKTVAEVRGTGARKPGSSLPDV